MPLFHCSPTDSKRRRPDQAGHRMSGLSQTTRQRGRQRQHQTGRRRQRQHQTGRRQERQHQTGRRRGRHTRLGDDESDNIRLGDDESDNTRLGDDESDNTRLGDDESDNTRGRQLRRGISGDADGAGRVAGEACRLDGRVSRSAAGAERDDRGASGGE